MDVSRSLALLMSFSVIPSCSCTLHINFNWFDEALHGVGRYLNCDSAESVFGEVHMRGVVQPSLQNSPIKKVPTMNEVGNLRIGWHFCSKLEKQPNNAQLKNASKCIYQNGWRLGARHKIKFLDVVLEVKWFILIFSQHKLTAGLALKLSCSKTHLSDVGTVG